LTAPKCSDDEFIELFEEVGPSKMAEKLGVGLRNVYSRRKSIEGRIGRSLVAPAPKHVRRSSGYEMRVERELKDGVIVVFSDAHFWPEERSTAFRGLLKILELLGIEVKIVVANGDVFDGAKVKRHPPIGWERLPNVNEELEACKDRLDEIQKAAPHAEFYWTLGNHDMRFETRLADRAPEYEGVPGTRLCDHFPKWKFVWNLWVNGLAAIKHRYKGGIHATHNNTVNAGMTVVTGHLHSLKVTPFSDYHGTRFGVDTGTLSDPYGEHTNYTEDNPLNHRSGFSVLTFAGGKLLWPELVSVLDETHVQFRGKIYAV
jgi:hypothetical protein